MLSRACRPAFFAKNYQLSKGDQVYLTLNGNYALHDDGDEIPDIAPMAIIPVQYIDDAM